jgi:hypothetical protein
MISSAINQTVLKKYELWVVEALAGANGKIDGGYEYKHHEFTKDNNFGVVVMKNINGQGYHTCQLVASVDAGAPQGLKVFNSKEFGHTPNFLQTSGCCNIF